MSIENTKAKLMASSTSIYREPEQRVGLRCGLGDAAALCDALEQAILEESRGHNGKGPPTKRGRELAAIDKRCGDEIWAMRNMVKVNDCTASPDTAAMTVRR